MAEDIMLKVGELTNREEFGRGIIRIDTKTMQRIGVREGDIIEIEGQRKTGAIAVRSYPADIGLNIIRMDGVSRRNAKIGVGETIKLRKAEAKPAKKVALAPAQKGVMFQMNPDLMKKNLMMRPVSKKDLVAPFPVMRQRGGLFDDIFSELMDMSMFSPIPGEAKLVVVSTAPEGIVQINEDTEIEIKPESVDVEEKEIANITYEDIGGMQAAIEKIREMVELPLRHPELFTTLGIDPPKGVLLYGPPGTGKTLLAKAVANESGAFFTSIAGPEIMSKWYGQSEENLRKIFEDAEKQAPSIIFIDEIDAIAPKREEVSGEVERRVVSQILTLMDGLKSRGKVIVIAATNRPNALDPALRRPGRFDREVEIGVPTEKGRLEVLQIHTRNMPLEKGIDLKWLASVTYGFVGADLEALAKEAAMSALRRSLPQISWKQEELPPAVVSKLKVTKEDFENALKMVEPSAMREVLIEKPNVRWTDVGGLEKVKQSLIEAVQWPLTNSQAFQKIGISPPKGILLYGPPGTGKTMLAKAVATESDANFISIKGPEILSKWVGESEKHVRDIFKRAKQVAPTIIFFDEIDAIAPTRGMSASGSRVTENVVSQILTEMSGMEELHNVVVIAATNRPDMIDHALMRPGRFDRQIMVPAPDENARLEILKVHTKKMPVARDVSLERVAKETEGYSGADLEALVREAGLNALRKDMNARIVTKKDFESAIEEVRSSLTPDLIRFYDKVSQTLKTEKVREEEKGKEMSYVG
jgi:transitional endoplasmic reticulum ATPase